jgi:hypothetical protein
MGRNYCTEGRNVQTVDERVIARRIRYVLELLDELFQSEIYQQTSLAVSYQQLELWGIGQENINESLDIGGRCYDVGISEAYTFLQAEYKPAPRSLGW